MSDPILTDDERGALLDGMSSGEIEVHSARGPTYAEVTPFEIGPRCRIRTNSFPRLQSLNRQFAGRLAKQVELMLNVDSRVVLANTISGTYSEACDNSESLSLIVEFFPKPLDGSAFIVLSAATVGNLVETFFGGQSNEPTDHEPEFFTPGEKSVAVLFGEAVLAVIREVWAPMENFAPELAGTHLSSGVIDSVDGGDPVIACEFDLEFGDKRQSFLVLWPVSTVASLLPVFEGQRRDRNAAEDSRWQHSIRSRVTDSIVEITSDVGHTRMTLRDVADLVPGDVIRISDPRQGTVSARNVPVMAGRFGIHNGRHAVEAINWLDSGSGSPAARSK